MDERFYCLHSEVCKTLANAKRQMILESLRSGELTVSQMVERTGVPQATLSQHLAIMRSKGVVVARRSGNNVYYSLTSPKILQAFDLITEVMREAEQVRSTAGDAEQHDEVEPA
ncbi:MAG: metalloregulator ArsR/SmtB family transcription factor [Coriobacteriales bacterium]